MRALLTTLLLAIGSSAGAQATPPAPVHPTPPATSSAAPAKAAPDRHAKGAQVFAGITLDAGQQERAASLVAKSRGEMQAVLARQKPGTPISKADRDTLHAIGERHNASYRQLLTATQRQRLDDNVAAAFPKRVGKSTAPATTTVTTTPGGAQ